MKSAHNDAKSLIPERVIRTLKRKSIKRDS